MILNDLIKIILRPNKEKNYIFLIEESIYRRLTYEVNLNNKIYSGGKHHLKLDVILFFINLITYRETKVKDKSQYGYVPLKAEYLKKYHYQYKIYFDFLELHQFIKVKTYSIQMKKCKQYKIIKPKVFGKFIRYSPQDFVVRKKLGNEIENKVIKAEDSTNHLTKWLNPEYLKIDYSHAVSYLETIKMSDSKKYMRRYIIEMIYVGKLNFQREGKDNRLHTTLTNLPKDLRPYLRYNKMTLVSLDIKSSQPYILSGFLNMIFNKDLIYIDKILRKIVINKGNRNYIKQVITTMIQETASTPVITDLKRFEALIKNDIYEHIANNLSEKFRYDIETPLGISDKFYNKRLGYKVDENFNSIRDYCKRIMLEYLYCSPKNKEKRYLEIKRILPKEVSRIINLFKEKDKTIFPIFLQNLESYIILDKITKTISAQDPLIPLFTIHDSIITLPQHSKYVKAQMEAELKSFLGINATIVEENWQVKTT